MKPWIPLIALAGLGLAASQLAKRETPTIPQAGVPTLLHNGWTLTPAGTSTVLPGDMPGTLVTIPGTRFAVVNTCGYHDQSINVIDLDSQKIVQTLAVGHDWIGMAFDPSRNELFVSGGSITKEKVAPKGADYPANFMRPILRFKWVNNQLVPQPGLMLPDVAPKDRFVSGITTDGKGTLFVANIQNDTVYRFSGADLSEVKATQLPYRPYGVALSPDGTTIATSNWGDGSVSLLDAATLQLRSTIKVGSHPNAIAYSPDGRLFVANAGSNTVSLIEKGVVKLDIRVSLNTDKRLGATPVGLTVGAGRLFVANADNNCIAVVDIVSAPVPRVIGFIPTGRYPSLVALDGKKLLVATAKGMKDSPNANLAAAPTAKVTLGGHDVPGTYVGQLLTGHLSFIDLPDGKQLANYTKQVFANIPTPVQRITRSAAESKEVLAAMKKIEHVVYIIRENRTYDQVLGDVPQGNGEPSITMFGKIVTPNSHRLLNQFLLLDNLYCDGEVSQVGHQWSDAAYANDYTEKQWILSYGRHGEVESDDRMFTSPGGYIWQNMLKHGKTARIYGEYLQWQEDHDAAHGPVKKDPEKYGCSAAFEEVFARGGRDTEKAEVFIKELKAAEKTGKWPNFMVMALNEDHTHGLDAGAFTPEAMVASNDYALGMVVDAVSHSAFWKNTAIFVIQDDAQNGSDHVDCHRTVGHVISPYTQRNGIVDSTMYSTCSMLHTMETILGVPPMSQYDAAATLMVNAFTAKPDFSPYNAVKPSINLNAKNPAKGELARRSAKLDFSDVDRADEQELNQILWAHTHPGTKMPAPVYGHIGR